MEKKQEVTLQLEGKALQKALQDIFHPDHAEKLAEVFMDEVYRFKHNSAEVLIRTLNDWPVEQKFPVNSKIFAASYVVSLYNADKEESAKKGFMKNGYWVCKLVRFYPYSSTPYRVKVRYVEQTTGEVKTHYARIAFSENSVFSGEEVFPGD